MSESVSQEKFYEAVQELKVEMAETKTLIRDYNGLRDIINDVDNRVQTLEDINKNKKNYREYKLG